MKKHQTLHSGGVPSDQLIPVVLLALCITTSVVANAREAPPAAPKHETAASTPAAAADDGTVTGTLTLNGKAITLRHIYGRKREAWPMDVQQLNVGAIDELSCGIVEVIITNVPVSDAVLTSILQNEYHGSGKIRGVCLMFEGAGKHSFVHRFLLESGVVEGFGITQSDGEVKEEHSRVTGDVKCKNDENTEARVFKVSFDTGVKLQYSQPEGAEPIPLDQFLDEFVRVMPGKWDVERWAGLGCHIATGTLTVVERSGPHEFRGSFHLEVGLPGEPGKSVDEDVTITRNGTKVHFEGGEVKAEVPWIRDVLNFDLRKDLLVGGADTDSVLLRKIQEAPVTVKPSP